ncbi:histidine phosphatase family protein [Pantoea sp. Ap-967]|uniref:lipopolysaccharide core heptose(II)-phosphate phosphatase PmrG n=1 Tax=Pantoea sp. Ap-967 TaxID=2608362 RepID=UPI00142220E5|nr:histidine phosphatase family protein [Pantoea sp. Ap-967]NIE73418.1 histidine phosphatase family protein [Pantoea sp. Ap-967]
MLEHTITIPQRAPRAKRRSRAWLAAAALLALAGVGLWQACATQVADLGSVQQMHVHGVYSALDNDEVIVLVRHAERCDRSNHACLNDPAGITREGSQAAAAVGDGLRRLGLAGADTLASPEVRTQQTAAFVFGKPIETQDWLARCDDTFARAALAHKREGHNLVLVTHSGCIDYLERRLGVAGGDRSPGYASALFIRKGSNGKAELLGQLNPNQWQALLSQTGK